MPQIILFQRNSDVTYVQPVAPINSDDENVNSQYELPAYDQALEEGLNVSVTSKTPSTSIPPSLTEYVSVSEEIPLINSKQTKTTIYQSQKRISNTIKNEKAPEINAYPEYSTIHSTNSNRISEENRNQVRITHSINSEQVDQINNVNSSQEGSRYSLRKDRESEVDSYQRTSISTYSNRSSNENGNCVGTRNPTNPE
ncbi:hypothetical protein PIROE2DRAFT_62594 [Piromyces sp. E2]|nr:hypothetical protein PIROE2DRAFT_62594 [Piromyces sp. E2]|eukprot:OUM61315.1 hypothetical protein PIROE2DRAFT_62594 [Piromyces sp. E2]